MKNINTVMRRINISTLKRTLNFNLIFATLAFVILFRSTSSGQATLPVISNLPFNVTAFAGTVFPGTPTPYLTIGTGTGIGNSTANLTTNALNGNIPGRWSSQNNLGISYQGNGILSQGCFQIRVNTLGAATVTVNWIGRTITNNANVNILRLQWRNGGIGAWNNVTGGVYTSGVTNGSFSNVLPVAASNIADLRLRWFYYSTGVGAYDRVALDNISIGTLLKLPFTRSAERCGPGSVTLTAVVGTGQSANWFSAPSGGSPLNGTPSTTFTTPSLSASTTYYVSTVDSVTGIGSFLRNPVLAVINALPTFASPATTSLSSICLGDSFNLSVGNGSASLAQSTYTNLNTYNIPDNNATGINSRLHVVGLTSNATIVNVKINIQHQRDRDLEIYLVRPGGSLAAGGGGFIANPIAGQSVRLVAKRGGPNGRNFVNTIFDDNATTSITAGIAPFTGTFTPEQLMNTLTKSNGNWHLRVFDDSSGRKGVVVNWSITFSNGNTFTTYSWSASPVNPTGFSSSSQNVSNVIPDAAGVITYTVTGADALGCTVSSSVNDVVNIIQAANAGPDQDICSTSTTLAASTPVGGTTGTWTLASGSGNIVSPTDTNSAVTGLGAGANIFVWTVNGSCGVTSDSVTINVVPANINAGPDQSICTSGTAALNGSIGGGATGSTWSSTGDGTFNNPSSLTAVYTPGAADISNGSVVLVLTTTGPCAGITDSVTITINSNPPPAPGPISGPISACVGDTVTLFINSVAGATSYNWYPSPNFTPGQFSFFGPSNDTTVTIILNNTNNSFWSIKVTANNGCASSYRSYAFRRSSSVPFFSAAPLLACPNDTVTYSVNAVGGATSYIWNAPAGAYFDGDPLNVSPYVTSNLSVTVTFPSAYTTGQVSVASQVACFTSANRSVTVNSTPNSPGHITGTFSVCTSATGVAYSIPAIPGAVSYTWTAPAHATISSGTGTNSITLDFDSTFTNGDISVFAVGACGPGGLRHTTIIHNTGCRVVVANGREQLGVNAASQTQFNVYPNPVHDKLNVSYSSAAAGNYTLQIVDISGRIILSQVRTAMLGQNNFELDLSKVSQGMYMVVLQNGTEKQQLKITVQ